MLSLKDSCLHPTSNKPYIKSIAGGLDNSPEGLQVRRKIDHNVSCIEFLLYFILSCFILLNSACYHHRRPIKSGEMRKEELFMRPQTLIKPHRTGSHMFSLLNLRAHRTGTITHQTMSPTRTSSKLLGL
jgi:hypothetical protein